MSGIHMLFTSRPLDSAYLGVVSCDKGHRQCRRDWTRPLACHYVARQRIHVQTFMDSHLVGGARR